jgi:hypothetical protein
MRARAQRDCPIKEAAFLRSAHRRTGASRKSAGAWISKRVAGRTLAAMRSLGAGLGGQRFSIGGVKRAEQGDEMLAFGTES